MEKSQTIAELAKALVAFQTEMQTVVYDADNPFFRSKYATLAALVTESKNLLAKNNLAVSQLLEDEGAVTTILMHSSGEFLISKVKLTPVKNDPQGLGSAITYSRRYAYASILGLVSDKDDDGNNASGKETTPVQATITTMKERVILEGIKKCGTPDKFKAWRVDHNLVEDLEKATEAQLSYVWAVLKSSVK